MAVGHWIALGFGGLFLANAVPHLVSGMMGRAFPSPFAKPPGEGLSSSVVNVAWGLANLVPGYVLLYPVGGFEIASRDDAIAAGTGFGVAALITARLFGRLFGGNAAAPEDAAARGQGRSV